MTATPDTPVGFTVDGDVMGDLIADAVPRYLTDTAAREIAERALDAAVAAGMTVLHGPDLRPRRPQTERRAQLFAGRGAARRRAINASSEETDE